VSAFAIQPMAGVSDIELMLGLKNGEEDCLEPLWMRHRRALIVYIHCLVQNFAVAEDLAQDVFLCVYRARARYEPSAHFTTWLYRIARNRTMNWLRDNRHLRGADTLDRIAVRMPSPGATPEQRLLRRDLRMRVRQAVDELPERQRSAVLLHKFRGLEYVEIAEVLGCTLAAVKALLNRAYTALRKMLTAC
jgi:RNA polymerase sigma-70 factor, ECF subfamily